jgi:diguanylate cyclase (GGDEF)-like protein
MSTLGGVVRALSPHSLLRIYLAVVVCTAVAAIGALLTTTATVDSRTDEAASLANVATAASQVQAGLREPLMLMLLNTYAFYLTSEELDSLTPEDRARVLQIVALGVVENDGESLPLPDINVPMLDRDAVSLQRSIDLYSAQIDEIVAGVDSHQMALAGVIQQRDELKTALDAYFDDNSVTNFVAVFHGLVSLGEELNSAEDQLALNVTSSQTAVTDATSKARIVTALALVFLAGTMAVATFFVGRLISRAFHSSETEREALRETTGTLQYRNDQLNALYNVFTEITDTLSMHYVIAATLRETLHVMNESSMAVMRLLQGDQLVAVGNLTAEGIEVPNMPPVPLGEGPTGRVARRGRSMRINQAAQSQLGPSAAPQDPNSGVVSGIIVPLIVGARVVGTLAVWSRLESAFTDEDERVLEMMASQVATAVVAADHAESSERRALHDPLTGLPNRRQLTEDITNHFERLPDEGMNAVAMIDVDHFKMVNDDFGHRVGDVSLQKIAAVLRNGLRDGDLIYRYGGEEFVVIFKGASGPDALVAADRLRIAVETTPMTGDQLETVSPVTISIGLALMPEHGSNINGLIEKADKAMYRAKENGRNRVEVWREEAEAQGLQPAVA